MLKSLRNVLAGLIGLAAAASAVAPAAWAATDSSPASGRQQSASPEPASPESGSLAKCQSDDIKTAIPLCTALIEDPATSSVSKASAYAARGQALTSQAYDEETKNAQDWSVCVSDDLDASLAACGRIIDNTTEDVHRRADALYNRSKRLLDKGRNQEAMADFQRSLKPFTDHQPGSRNRAVEDYSNALKLNPGQSHWLAARGQLYLSIDDATRASADFDQALAVNATEGMALLGRALLRNSNGDPVGAVGDLKTLAALPADTDEAKWLHQTATQLLSRIGAD